VEPQSFTSHSPSDLPFITAQIKQEYLNNRIFALEGELGSGKTTFVKAFCELLGIKENVSSPTFTIVHEYGGGSDVYHFDLYRLKALSELQQIGFEEYLESGAYIFIEWPELARPLLPEHYVEIRFEVISKNERKLHCRLISQ
jgi:tRNA threonylcarbamoyladenosine biosynthesis protein TsaE